MIIIDSVICGHNYGSITSNNDSEEEEDMRIKVMKNKQFFDNYGNNSNKKMA